MKSKKGKIFILSGPSGSGKTTLYQKLLKRKKLASKLVKNVSVTTRERRAGERNGVDYFFVSRKMFLFKKRSGHFLENEKVFDNYYGTPKKAVFDHINSGKSVLLCIDVKGARSIRSKYPKAISIFVRTKSFQTLKKRLTNRGSEDPKRLKLRLSTAKKELEQAKYYTYQVVNERIPKALKDLENIILSEISK